MNRRKLLACVAFAAGAAPTGALARLMFSKTVVPIPTAQLFQSLQAGSGWTGAPGSGSRTDWASPTSSPPGAPLYNTRAAYNAATGLTANAMPVVRWFQDSQIRGVGTTQISVIADAKGGISHVDFECEGNVAANVTVTYITAPDTNGVSRTRPLWGVSLDCANAYGRHSTGAVRVYARAYSTDPTMTPRTIGPITVYPRAVAYDWDKTVNSGGGADYTTLSAAMQAMKTALAGGAECGRVTITGGAGDYGSGQYEWGAPNDTTFPWSKGMSCVRVLPGQSATIVRGASFDPYRTNAWAAGDTWGLWTYVNNLTFQGQGLTIDRKNVLYILPGAGAPSGYNLDPYDGTAVVTGRFMLDGCQVTNSIGDDKQSYWNGAPAPPFGGGSLSDWVISFAQGCAFQYQCGPGSFAGGQKGASVFNSWNHCFGTVHDPSFFVFGDYYANSNVGNSVDASYYRTTRNGMTVHYVGASATATFSYDGVNFTLKENGSAVLTLPMKDAMVYPKVNDGSYYTLYSQVVAAINAHGSGWSATLVDDTFQAYWSNIYSNVDCKTSTLTVNGQWDLHSEYAHWYGSFENVLVWDTTVAHSTFGTALLNNETVAAGSPLWRDVSVKNLTYDDLGSGEGSTGSNFYGYHICYENITAKEPFYVGENSSTYYPDSYSSFQQVVTPMLNVYGVWTSPPVLPTNCVIGGSNQPPSGHGNVSLGASPSDPTWAALFNNRAGKDWTPAAGGTLATNPFTSINSRDAQAATRSTTDAAGAWKTGGAVPTWPF